MKYNIDQVDIVQKIMNLTLTEKTIISNNRLGRHFFIKILINFLIKKIIRVWGHLVLQRTQKSYLLPFLPIDETVANLKEQKHESYRKKLELANNSNGTVWSERMADDAHAYYKVYFSRIYRF